MGACTCTRKTPLSSAALGKADRSVVPEHVEGDMTRRTMTAGIVLAGLLIAAWVPAQATGAATAATPAAGSTADCDSVTTCYTPEQLQVAYGVKPLLDRGIDGRGETVVLPELAESTLDPPLVSDMPSTPAATSASSTRPSTASPAAAATTRPSTTSPWGTTPSSSRPGRSPAIRPDQAGTRSPAGAAPTPGHSSHCLLVSRIDPRRRALRGGRGTGQEIAAFTSSATFFSTMGLHFLSAYDTGHTSPSSRFAASWKPRVE